jgi:WD40 repeat protein/serine/threonine protein kinase
MSESDARSAVVLELAEEFLARYRRGERPPLKEYVDRHPELEAEIREVFPAMALLENIALTDEPVDRTGPTAAAGPLPFRLLGDFSLIREVGRGGMGVVYEAEQVSLGRHVAVKVLPLQVHSADRRNRFDREAKAAARLHHTNIVPVFGVGEQDGQPYYVMQFIQGLGLDTVLIELKHLAGGPAATPGPSAAGPAAALAQSLVTGSLIAAADPHAPTLTTTEVTPETSATLAGPAAGRAPSSTSSAALSLSSRSAVLPGQAGANPGRRASYWQSVAQIGIQVANALDYAHKQGVLHRDIKPSNLLLDLHGTVWVTDFGLSKAADHEDLTRTGDVVGTLRYLPPEAFEGRYDSRGDVYSLGLTLYELVALRRAFGDVDRWRVVKQITTGEPLRLDRVVPAIPRDLATIIHKAIAREPGGRYQSAAELAADLQRFADDRPIQARRIRATERAWRWARRNPLAAGLAAASVLLLVAGSVSSAVLGLTATAARNRADASAGEAIENARLATDERNRALVEQKRADREADAAWAALYVVRLNAVQIALEHSDAARALDLLQLVQTPRTAGTKPPGWEWRYHWRACHGDLRTLAGHVREVRSLAVSPDGTRLVSCADDKVLREWDPATGQLLRQLPLDDVKEPYLALSADGTRLAVGSANGTLRILDANTWQDLHRFAAHPKAIRGMAFSPDGTRLATAGEDRTAKVWDVAGGRLFLTLTGHTDQVRGLAFSPDGQWLATGSQDATVRLWDAATGRPVHTLTGHTAGVNCVAFSADGRQLASAGKDWGVRLWDPAAGHELQTMTGHTSEVRALAFSPDGKVLASGGHDRSLKLWDVATARERATYLGHRSGLYCLAFSPDGAWLGSGSSDGTVRVWSSADDPGDRADRAHRDQVRDVKFSPDGRWLASVGLDGRVIVRDVVTGRSRNTAAETGPGLLGMAFSPDSQLLATAGDAGAVTVWDLATGRPRYRVSVHSSWASGLAFSPDGRTLASGSNDHFIQLLDADTGQVQKTLKGHKDEIKGLVFSPDGCRLYSGSSDETIKVWDPATGQEVRTFKGHSSGVTSLALSEDGRRLASASSDHTAKIWDPESGRVLHTLAGHNDVVWSVAFIGDGSRVVTAGFDQSVRVWDTSTGFEVAMLKGHTDRVLGVAVSPDGGLLATAGGRDLTVRVWDGRPMTEATRVEREAVDLLNFLFSRPLRKADVIAYLTSARSLHPEVRQTALGLAERYVDASDARTYTEAAWVVLRNPHANATVCRFALAQATAARDLAPADKRCRATLAVAQYRLGRFQKEFLPKAVATLDESDPNDPVATAVLAMTRFRLDQVDPARTSLGRLRQILSTTAGTTDPDAEALSREAERLIDGPTVTPKQ